MHKYKTNKAYFSLATLFFIAIFTTFGQDVELSQYWTAPMHINPAMTGISVGPRVSLNYRNQWPELGDGFNGGFTTYMAGVDGYIAKARSGIGILYTGDYIANGLLSTNKVTMAYAFQIKFSRKLGLRIGIEGSFINRRIKWNDFTFSDMINPYTGFYNNFDIPNNTSEIAPQKFNTYGGDAGLGFLLFNNIFYTGFSLRNAIMPKESFYTESNSRTPFRMIFHAGANFNIKHAYSHKYNIFISPNVLFANQGNNFQFNAGVMSGVSLVYFGAWFRYAMRNPDAIIAVLGIRKGKIRFGYSYDATISKLVGRTGGSHELSLIFNWSGSDDNSLNPNSDKAYIECPEILKF
jgi:type IX secretion system PorP/SprF family membrane protein